MGHQEGTRPRIGVIDDSPVFTTALSGFLGKNGHDVVVFNNPLTALERLKSTQAALPDIFVTDFDMPEMSGLDFIRACKAVEHLRDIPTLILTARNFSEFLISAIEAGADAFASKDSINEVIMAQIMALTRVANLRKSRNEIEATLRADRFEVLFESLSEGVLILDRQGKVRQFNPLACKILGVTSDELLQRNFSDLEWRAVRADRAEFPLDERPSRVVLQTGLNLRDVRMGVFLRNSELRWFCVNASPIFLKPGSPAEQAILSFRDITDELASADAQRAMVASSKMALLGEMASGIAHEINNPLTILSQIILQMNNNRKKNELDNSKLDEYLAKLEKNVVRIEKIVHGLKAYSRNSEADPMEALPVQTIIDNVMELSRERVTGGAIEMRIQCGTGDTIVCRPSQIVQVLTNLVANAMDAIAQLKEKWISIEVSTGEKNVLISVTDSGSGIEKEVLKRLMEPFFTTKPVGKGTGLGLSISRKIVADHGGLLYYDSACANTRFVVELPKPV